MSELYSTIMSLCEEKGVSGYRLCKDTGMQPSVLTDLKMGRQKSLSAVNAERVASYFGVTVSRLLGKEDSKKPDGQKTDGLSPAKIKLLEYVKQMSDADLEKLEMMIKLVESKG